MNRCALFRKHPHVCGCKRWIGFLLNSKGNCVLVDRWSYSLMCTNLVLPLRRCGSRWASTLHGSFSDRYRRRIGPCRHFLRASGAQIRARYPQDAWNIVCTCRASMSKSAALHLVGAQGEAQIDLSLLRRRRANSGFAGGASCSRGLRERWLFMGCVVFP